MTSAEIITEIKAGKKLEYNLPGESKKFIIEFKEKKFKINNTKNEGVKNRNISERISFVVETVIKNANFKLI